MPATITTVVHPGATLRLYERTRGPTKYREDTSCPELVNSVKALHKWMSEKHPTVSKIGPDWDCTERVESEFGENGGELKGKKFRLEVPVNKTWGDNHHKIRIIEECSAPYAKMLQESHFEQSLHSRFPVYHVQITPKHGETSNANVKLVLPIGGGRDNCDSECVVLQHVQGNGSTWKNITSQCKKVFDNNTTVIDIPIEKTTKIWVVHVKRSLRGFIHVLLALLVGKLLFRVMVLYKFQGNSVFLRILGMREELFQNPLGLKTDLQIAKEQGYREADTSSAKQLLRNTKLLLSIHQANKLRKSFYFHLSKVNTCKVALREDFPYDFDERQPLIQVQNASEDNVELWSIDLSMIVQEEKKEMASEPDGRCEGCITDQEIPKLAHAINRDWQRAAIGLGMKMDDVDVIKANNPESDVEKRCSVMLRRWRATSPTPTRDVLRKVLEMPAIGRPDVFSQKDTKIPESVLLELSAKVAPNWKELGHSLNVTPHDIAIIDANHPNDVVGKCMDLLWGWLRQESSSVDQLEMALRSSALQRHDLANDLEKSTRL